MNDEARPDAAAPVTLSKRNLVWRVGLGLIVATVIVFVAILPAEFRYDPLGVGKATGLLGLSGDASAGNPGAAGPTSLAYFSETAFRTDSIEIPLTADGEFVGDRLGGEIEYKVKMKQGATLVYSWTVAEVPTDEFYYDFHGESLADSSVVQSFKQATGASSHGSLVAPFDGIHGWYFQNQSVKPVVVRLKLSGFYELYDMSRHE